MKATSPATDAIAIGERQAEDCAMRYAKIAIADRYPVILEGLGRLLGGQRDFKIVASCSDGASCIDSLREFAPDILIFDVLMPGVTALELLSIINSEKLSTRLVLFVSSDESDAYMISGTTGHYIVVSKHLSPETLLQTLRQVANTQRTIPRQSSDEGIRAQNVITGNALATLTERERQIVHLVSEGLSNKEVGRRLSITDGTIKVHLHRIFQKLEINNRTVLAALAISRQRIGDVAKTASSPTSPE